jgi:hypothetical protein
MGRRLHRHRAMHSIAAAPTAEFDQVGKAKPGNPKTQIDHRSYGIDVHT